MPSPIVLGVPHVLFLMETCFALCIFVPVKPQVQGDGHMGGGHQSWVLKTLNFPTIFPSLIFGLHSKHTEHENLCLSEIMMVIQFQLTDEKGFLLLQRLNVYQSYFQAKPRRL